MQTTPFTFRIRKTAREAWNIVINNAWFFIGTSLISVIFNITGGEGTPWVLAVILTIASIIWSMIYLQVGLAAARGQESKLRFAILGTLIPSLKDILRILGIGIVTGFLVLCGLILFIIPGIYIAVRLSFAILAYFDRKEGVMASVRYSWNITKGKFWTIALTGLFALLICLGGLIALVIGLLIAAPIARILTTKLYLALSDHYNQKEAVVVQSVEIPADLPEVSTTEQTA